jgi:hypothetical protein
MQFNVDQAIGEKIMLDLLIALVDDTASIYDIRAYKIPSRANQGYQYR